jgi:predicted glutamine amidotransferase
MCKLFFTLHDEKISEHVKEFLAQSNQSDKPNTTCGQSKDGFGLAWVNPDTNRFEIYKQPFSYDKDENLDNIIKTLPKKMVIGHIREKIYGDESYENTHPFLHDNQIFMHNGNITDFEKHAKFIKSYIARKFHHSIKGETDSEVLFYLLLSFMEYCKNKPAYKKNTTRRKTQTPKLLSKKQIHAYQQIDVTNAQNCAVAMMFRFFQMNSITLSANIIYSSPTETIIVKYASPGINYKPLYLNRCNAKGILITTKLLRNYNSAVIPENTLLRVDYTGGTIRLNKIL